MDYNKLIRDIIRAAKEDPAVRLDTELPLARLTTTLKLEVKVSKTLCEVINQEPINSTKLLLLNIND